MHQPIAFVAAYGLESDNHYLHRSERAGRFRNERFREMFKDSTYAKAGQGVLQEIARVAYVCVLPSHNTKDIDVDTEQQKWKAEFGEAVALRL
jgi:hypothetical protein